MSRAAHRTPLARADLLDQFQWYAEQGGTELGDRFLDAAEQTFGELAATPHMGSLYDSHDDRLSEIRKWRVNHPFEVMLVFYRVRADGVQIVRVINSSRDLPPLLNDADSE